ncbi:MAG: ComEC/Rec2 family competence protein [Solirubrobacterales bacterium]
MREQRLPALLIVGVAAVALLALAHTGRIRARAEVALGTAMPEREAELARGFVLGEDDAVDRRTVEDFRRSGLSHLLAVSGQNVALLALLAMPVLAAFGIPLRGRLVWVLGLIAVYVPLAGAGPSIQRAGVMGALAVLASLAGRRASRFYALVLAAVITLALNPRIAGDIGWQLSFAAVLGILLLARPLRGAIAAGIGGRGLGGVIADGAAMTVAATLATAPLIALHFEAVSTLTLVANLLALPAVAPAMWLGMLAAGAGQVPGFPVEVFNFANAPLLGYIAQVAAWCGRPSWAYVHVHLSGAGLAVSYLAITMVAVVGLRIRRRFRVAAARKASKSKRPIRGRAAAAGFVLLGLAWIALTPEGGAGGSVRGLRVSVLDVGQGDAILLQPAEAPAVLVDGGPKGDELAAKLQAAGVDGLGAAIVTHDQADHVGGIAELLGAVPVARFLYGSADREMVEEAAADGAVTRRLARGSELRSGDLRLDVLWPPPELLAGLAAGDDPNQASLVIRARWHRFSMLLTGDAEADGTPIETEPVDVLKVAHHGSEDAGLGELLGRIQPSLAVISVGEDNPFGHPTGKTLATLAAHGVRTLRTDRDGTIVLDVGLNAVTVQAGD